jgi:hypothetical protein
VIAKPKRAAPRKPDANGRLPPRKSEDGRIGRKSRKGQRIVSKDTEPSKAGASLVEGLRAGLSYVGRIWRHRIWRHRIWTLSGNR